MKDEFTEINLLSKKSIAQVSTKFKYLHIGCFQVAFKPLFKEGLDVPCSKRQKTFEIFTISFRCGSIKPGKRFILLLLQTKLYRFFRRRKHLGYFKLQCSFSRTRAKERITSFCGSLSSLVQVDEYKSFSKSPRNISKRLYHAHGSQSWEILDDRAQNFVVGWTYSKSCLEYGEILEKSSLAL